MEPRSQRVQGADGLTLHVVEWSSAGVPVLFLHGFANEAHIWDDVVPTLAPYYRCLALDQRGHGRSDFDPEGRYDHLSMARDVEAVCAALGIERLALVGHSMGGRVAMRFAGLHPDRLAGLVIVDAGPDLDPRGVTRIRDDAGAAPESFASVAEYKQLVARAYPMATPKMVDRMAEHGLRRREDGRWVPRLDPAFRRGMRGDAGGLRQRAENETPALWEALGKVRCPALVVRGAASDVLSADTAERMAGGVLAKGTLVVIPQAGHSVPIDNPAALRRALERFALGDA